MPTATRLVARAMTLWATSSRLGTSIMMSAPTTGTNTRYVSGVPKNVPSSFWTSTCSATGCAWAINDMSGSQLLGGQLDDEDEADDEHDGAAEQQRGVLLHLAALAAAQELTGALRGLARSVDDAVDEILIDVAVHDGAGHAGAHAGAVDHLVDHLLVDPVHGP